ncbi:hypothetical protein [Rhizobium sp. LEGMi135b]
MRRILPTVLLCMVADGAIADDDQKMVDSMEAFTRAGFDTLSAAYVCRNVVSADRYLKLRKTIEIAFVDTIKDTDLVRKTVDSWEKAISNSPIYKNHHPTADQCADWLLMKLQKFKAASDVVQSYGVR